MLYSLAVVSAIVMFVLSVPVGFYTVFFTTLSTHTPPYNAQTQYQVPVYIALLTIRLPFDASYGVTFAVLTAVIVLFIALAAWQGGGIVKALKATPQEGVSPLLRNPLTATVIILGASLLLTILLDYVQTSAGVATGGVSGDPLELLISFVLAPFIEEIGYRFFLIGFPLFLVLLLTRDSLGRAVKTLWRPSAAWDADASGARPQLQEYHKLLVVLLVALSAVVFGLAHYLSGAGWSVGKIERGGAGRSGPGLSLRPLRPPRQHNLSLGDRLRAERVRLLRSGRLRNPLDQQ